MELVPDALNDPPRWKNPRKISSSSQQSASTQESDRPTKTKKLLKNPAKYEKPLGKPRVTTKIDSGELIRSFQLLKKEGLTNAFQKQKLDNPELSFLFAEHANPMLETLFPTPIIWRRYSD